jgi:hypothetical protein
VTSEKIGRNSPCWCGSGRKYKKCHLDRAKEPAAHVGEIIEQFSRSRKTRLCLHPNAGPGCQGRIIKAHTIQRGGGLTQIAENGHVYTLNNDPAPVLKSGCLSVRLAGVKNASTFTGFCAHHDKVLFQPIEDFPFTANIEQAFLLAYRALARDLYAKRAQVADVPHLKTLDRGMPITEQISHQTRVNAYGIGSSRGLEDIERLKNELDRALLSREFSVVSHYVIEFDRTPDVLCSGVTNPVYDFQGTILQDLSDLKKNSEILTFSLIPTETGGAAVFAWLQTEPAGRRLVDSLNSFGDGDIPHAVLRFIFQNFENLCMSPKWWDGLPETHQQRLLRRMENSAAIDIPWDPKDLMDDGLRVIDWRVVQRIQGFARR